MFISHLANRMSKSEPGLSCNKELTTVEFRGNYTKKKLL